MKKLGLLLMTILIVATSYSQQLKIVDTSKFKKGEVLVKFKVEANEKWLKKYNVHIKKLVYTKAMKREGKKGFYIMEVSDVLKSVEDMKSDNEVLWVEPNYKVEHQGFSSDPLYSNLWGMENIKAPTAWNSGNKGSQEILVGIIDEGIMRHHEDLCGQVWTNPFDPVDGVDNDGNGYIDDENGWDFLNDNNNVFKNADNHGTHVAGTIGGIGDNNLGVIGVAPLVKMISAKFLQGYGYIADGIEAIDYVTDLKQRHNLNIIATNNSWGGGQSSALYDAINRAKQADILFIAAAGNGSGNDNDLSPFYPASFDLDNIISVAAIDANDQLASFSCFGKTTVDIGAPGVGIQSSVAWSTLLSGYDFYNGTSMATPHVTGAAVLYKAINPTATGAQIKAAILNSARPIPALTDKVVTGGTLDVSSFAGNTGKTYVNTGCTLPEMDLTRPTAPSNLRVWEEKMHPNAVTLKFDPSVDNESGLYTYYLLIYENGVNIINWIWNDLEHWENNTGTIPRLNTGKDYRFVLYAIDKFRNWSEASNEVTVRTYGDSSIKLITKSFHKDTAITANNIWLRAYGASPTEYSYSVTYNWRTLTPELPITLRNDPYSANAAVPASGMANGAHIIEVTGTEYYSKGIAKDTITVYVNTSSGNTPPTVTAGSDVTVDFGTSVTLNANGSDAEGSISYSWTQVEGQYTPIPTPSSNSVTFPTLQPGVYVFRVTVSDQQGLTASDDVKVTILIANPSIIRLTGTVLSPTNHRLNWTSLGWTPTSYVVQYTKSSTFSTLATLPPTTTTYSNTVKGGGTAKYRVLANYSDNSVVTSNEVALKIGGKMSRTNNILQFTNYPAGSHFNISSFTGMPLMSGTIKSSNHTENVSNLGSAFYIVTVLYPDGEVESEKFAR